MIKFGHRVMDDVVGGDFLCLWHLSVEHGRAMLQGHYLRRGF